MTADVRVEEVRLPRDTDGRVDLGSLRDVLGHQAVLETSPDAPGTVGWSYAVVRSVGHVRAGHRSFSSGSSGRDLTATFHAALGAGDDRGSRRWADDPLAALDSVSDLLGLTPDATPDADLPAFTGGWVGLLGHDLVRTIEQVPDLHDRSPTRHLDLQLVDTVLAWHPDETTALLVHRPVGADTGPIADAGGGIDLAGIARRLGAAGRSDQSAVVQPPRVATSSMGRAGHRRAVRRALEHIGAGDVFQVNVTHQIATTWDGSLLELYAALRRSSPAAYGAVIPYDQHDGGVVSVSPETFLHANGRSVAVRPIKGTRRRHPDDPAADLAAAEELAASLKDRAENVMVVDMERNDLGRVCEVGTVRVPVLLEVERHPTVWHLVSTVEGTLRPDVRWGGLLRATFPCGSVTGTPKVRALQLIEEIEPVRRGIYCGAIGFLGAGTAHLSVAIRTAVLDAGGRVSYGTGGGIVADSDPDDEWQESLDKAAAFFTATNASLQEEQR